MQTIALTDAEIDAAKARISQIFSNPTTANLEQVVMEAADVVGANRFTLILDSKQVPFTSENFAAVKDKLIGAIARIPAYMQKRLGDNYPEFEDGFLRIVEAMALSQADLVQYQLMLNTAKDFSRQIRQIGRHLAKGEKESESEHQRRVKEFSENRYATPENKRRLERVLKEFKTNQLGSAVTYYLGNFVEVQSTVAAVRDFYEREYVRGDALDEDGENQTPLERTLDILEVMYLPFNERSESMNPPARLVEGSNTALIPSESEARLILHPQKINYIQKAKSLLRERPLGSAVKWGYKVRDLLDEQKKRGKPYNLASAIDEATEECFRIALPPNVSISDPRYFVGKK